tara:strand:- start:8914 stop:9405 length:492 start_codon:yes stop_codon:yes gene_type:complete
MGELDRVLRYMNELMMTGQRPRVGLGSMTDLEMREPVGIGRMTENEMMSNPSGLGGMSEYELAQRQIYDMMQPRTNQVSNLSNIQSRVLSDVNYLINNGLLGFTGDQGNEVLDGLLEQQYIDDIANSYDEMSKEAYNEGRAGNERELELKRLRDEERFFGRAR